MNKIKAFLPTAVALLAAVATAPALAQDDESDPIPGTIAGSVALTSDYIFRGISQTDNNPAIQGSLEYSYDTGYGITPYIGFWGSNVDFNDGDKATVEIDTLFGIRGEIEDTGLSWNLGGIYYAYPGASKSGGQALNYDYWEIPVSLSYSVDIVTLTGSYFYSPDFFGATGHAHYVNGKVEVAPEVPYVDLSLFAALGYQNIEDAKDYTDWTLGGTVTFKGVDFTVAYTDTNLTQSDLGGNKLADGRVIFTVGASF
jgi:uncharacterized protein (TIGR02001 family)